MARKKNPETAAETVAENKTEIAAVTETASETKAEEIKTAEKPAEEAVPVEKPKAATKGRKPAASKETSPADKGAEPKRRGGRKKADVAAEPVKKDEVKTEDKPKTARAKKTAPKTEKKKLTPYEQTVAAVRSKVCHCKTARDFAVQVTLTGANEGIFYIKTENQKSVVEAYDYQNADINMTADYKTFTNLLNKKGDFEKAVEKGDIEMKDGRANPSDPTPLSTMMILKKMLF